MSKEKNGSLEGSKHVQKQSTGNAWGGDGWDEGGNSATDASGSAEKHGQKKAHVIKPLNAGGSRE